MQKINYQKKLDEIILNLESKVPKLLLHACCAPCSSYVMEYLSNFFFITVLFYNPNIYPREEYTKRADELKRLIESQPHRHPVSYAICDFDSEEFYSAIHGLEACPEGGERCKKCYRLRLTKAAQYAKEQGFDYFASTLSISPLKNSQILNSIGEEISKIYGVSHLPNDFKKKEGYKRSLELSREYNLYRQNYCGCIYSVNRQILD